MAKKEELNEANNGTPAADIPDQGEGEGGREQTHDSATGKPLHGMAPPRGECGGA